MSMAAILRELMAAGLAGEALIAAVERIELAAPMVADEQADRRRKADRERKRRVKSLRNSAESAESAEPKSSLSPRPSLSQESSPIPPLTGVPFPSFSEQPSRQALSDEIWQASPQRARRRSGKRSLDQAVAAALKRGADPVQMLAGVRAYYASDDALEQNRQFAQGVHTLIVSGRWEAFTEPEEGASRTAAWGDDEWRTALEVFGETGRWPDVFGPMPGDPGCRVPSTLLIGAVA